VDLNDYKSLSFMKEKGRYEEKVKREQFVPE